MKKLIITCAMVLFGMFFGAGNLVFSLKIGQSTTGNWLPGFAGLIISDVVLSFFGLFFVLSRHNGDSSSFFGEVGKVSKICIPFLALSLLGPLGVAPRCVTVSFGGINRLFPELPLWLFSSIFCMTSYLVGCRGQRVVNIVGKLMTPILIASMIALFVLGVVHSHQISKSSTTIEAFEEGFITGYQTMDLLLAFFSAAMISSRIREAVPNQNSTMATKIAIKSSILASILLALVYFCMVFLGSHFSDLLGNSSPSTFLVIITNHIAGDLAALFVAVIMTFACFTSVAPLNAMFAEYLTSTLKLGNSKFNLVLLGTTIVSFLISLFDFSGIIKFLSPTLEALYPSLVALTIVSIFCPKQYLLKKIIFYGVLLVVILRNFGHLI